MSAQLYYYTARAQDGRGVAGTLRVESPRDAVARLRSRGLFVTSLANARSTGGWIAALRTLRISRGWGTTRAMRSLAVLVGSGVSLRRSLQCVIDQCGDPFLKEALGAIGEELDSGTPLSECMRRRPVEFRDQVVALIAAGELGGTIDLALERAADLLERESALRRQVTRALAYPSVVVSAALGLVIFLLVATVPAFAGILAQLHAQLPFPTRVMLAASELVRQAGSWVVATLLLGAASAALAACRSNARLVAVIDRVRLGVPVIGPLQRSANVAVFARTLGTLLRSGVIITEAIRTTAAVMPNRAFRTAALEMRLRLSAGSTLAPLLAGSCLFDAAAVEMTYVGEESGTLDAMLVRIADHCEEEVRHGLHILTGVLEPAMIVVLGAVIGTIVASILVPLYGAIGSIR